MRVAPDRTRVSARLKPDGRALTVAALALLAVLAWLYLWRAPMPMPGPDGVASQTYAAFTFLMWLVMMVAMMTPAVAPFVLLFDRVQRYPTGGTHARTWTFTGGYFTAWAAFSAAVTGLQLLLIRIAWLDTMTVSQRAPLTGSLLLAVGIYQWLPAKVACLEHCRGPVDFLTRHYRPGLVGGWRMGLEHGLYCVGCCWLLMLLLFVGGMMNLVWIAVLTLAISFERLQLRRDWLRHLIGTVLALAGGAVLVQQIGSH